MNSNELYEPSECLHRLVKHIIDADDVASIAEAEARFNGYRLALEITGPAAADPVAQATLLTAVALGSRVFLGGVHVSGDLDHEVLSSIGAANTLSECIPEFGGIVGPQVSGIPTIVIGGQPGDRQSQFCIRTATGGWRGGLFPNHYPDRIDPGPANPLAGMLSAALAINEAYLHVSGQCPIAGRRPVGMSLWNLKPSVDWIHQDESEPVLSYLPSQLWLIGLGHLGQAFLWGIGLLPYAKADDVSLVLQDVDIVTPSTLSTSVLSTTRHIGRRKTRAMAEWAESRGFKAAIHERLFDSKFTVQDSEPPIALCGLDNALGRRALDKAGFKMVVEAGLGRGYQNFRSIRLHTLPGQRSASEIWQDTKPNDPIEHRPAYKKLLSDGTLDQCGMTLLAGKAVGAPFVGATAATLALSEILRLLHGGTVHGVIDIDMLSLEQRTASIHGSGFPGLNPGFSPAIHT